MLTVALLHPAAELDWLRWTIHPSTVIGIVALGALYFWRARQTPPPGERGTPTAGQRVAFLLGLLVMFSALNGPIHDLSDYYLFSAHMVQHLLLTMVVVPLLLFGTTGWMLRPLLRIPGVEPVARRLTVPAACFVIFNLTLALWHLPPLYNAAMASHDVHIVQHLCFLAASTFMWWPLLSPMPELPRPSYPKQMLYTMLLMLPMMIISVYITYADSILYPAYASAPRIWGLSPLDDQRLGGLIMWIPGSLMIIGILTVVFFKWSSELERREATV
jgi:putative membrane protein